MEQVDTFLRVCIHSIALVGLGAYILNKTGENAGEIMTNKFHEMWHDHEDEFVERLKTKIYRKSIGKSDDSDEEENDEAMARFYSNMANETDKKDRTK